MQVRVLLAINHPQIADKLAKIEQIKIVADLYFREAVLTALEKEKADVLVLSGFLPGGTDLFKVAFEARSKDIRVIYLAGDGFLEERDPLIMSLLQIGIYDILFNPVDDRLRQAIFNPMPFSRVAKMLQGVNRNVNRKSLYGVDDDNRYRKEKQESILRSLPFLPDRSGKGKASENTGEIAAANATVKAAKEKPKTMSMFERLSIQKQERHLKDLEEGGVRLLVSPSSSLVVCCWSPAPTGKTFVAVNMAALAAAVGEKVALVDLDLKCKSVYNWLNIDTDQEDVYSLLKGENAKGVMQKNISVFGASSELPSKDVSPVEGFLEKVAERFSLVVVDFPGELSTWHEDVLSRCDIVAVIVDSDFNHLVRIAAEKHRVPKNSMLVVNKYFAVKAPMDFAKNMGISEIVEAIRIPLVGGEIFDSIMTGEPLSVLNVDLGNQFSVLLKKIKHFALKRSSIS